MTDAEKNVKRPPLGVMPRKLWDEIRRKDIREAISRYLDADKPISPEWIEEYNERAEISEKVIIPDVTHGIGMVLYYDLTGIPTRQLADELTTRVGVTEYDIGPFGEMAQLTVEKRAHGSVERIEGPARIFVYKENDR